MSLWGGIVINGNGITNNCNDAERAADQCHVVSEGQPSHYGGDDNADNSGVLRYVIVKHTGFEVARDDELNGITFNAVGSGTTVENIQVYSTYDDGLRILRRRGQCLQGDRALRARRLARLLGRLRRARSRRR